jgi:hypothetical protein
MKYAVAICDQGRFAPTVVADFVYQSKENLHVWKGTFATSMSELCQQVNEALKALETWADPWLTLRVVEIDEASEPMNEHDFAGLTPMRLAETIERCDEQPPIKLRKLKAVSK